MSALFIRQKSTAERYPRSVDIIAAVLFIVLFSYLFIVSAFGMSSMDESCYYTFAERQLLGDRLLIDDWHVSQLSSVLQMLPYWLYTRLAGSTEGLILFMRRLYLAVDLILYWFLYSRFRKHGVWGLIPVGLFCVFLPMGIFALSYYTMALHGLTVVSCLLFLGKEKKNWYTLVFAGVVAACAVLAEPFLAALYLLWCLLLLCRATAKRNGKALFAAYDFVLNGRTWLLTTTGIAVVAIVFFVYLFIRSPLPEIIKGLPELFTDHEYAFGGEGSKLLDPGKVIEAVKFYGIVPILIFPVITLFVFFLRKGTLSEKWKPALFWLNCVCLVGAYAFAGYLLLRYKYLVNARTVVPPTVYYCYYHGFPMLLFGLNCHLLCSRKDPRLFCFWAVGFFASLMIDFSSELVLGMGASVALFEIVLSFRTVWDELSVSRRSEAKVGTEKASAAGRFRLTNAVAVLCVCAILCWDGYGIYTYGFFHVCEQMANVTGDTAMTATIDRGPLKGIRTIPRISAIYDDFLADLDEIKSETDGPFYVAALLPYLYLYAELPFGGYSSWYVPADSQTRQVRYWELHPEKRPSYIYVPFYPDYYYVSRKDDPEDDEWCGAKLAFFRTVCSCEIREGKAGYIIAVRQWRL